MKVDPHYGFSGFSTVSNCRKHAKSKCVKSFRASTTVCCLLITSVHLNVRAKTLFHLNSFNRLIPIQTFLDLSIPYNMLKAFLMLLPNDHIRYGPGINVVVKSFTDISCDSEK